MTTKKNDGLSLGIDLGGSKIYAVVTDADNTILSRAKIPTPANADPEKLAEGLVRTGKEALEALNNLRENARSD